MEEPKSETSNDESVRESEEESDEYETETSGRESYEESESSCQNNERYDNENWSVVDNEEFEMIELERVDISKCENIEESAKKEQCEEQRECEEEKDESEELDESQEAQVRRKCAMRLLDTLKCKDFMNKFVKVITSDENRHVGILKYLDPMSGDMIIVNANKDRPNVLEKILIFSETCISVTLLEENKSNSAVRKVLPYFTVKRFKMRLMNWFKDMHLEVQEDEDNSIIVSNVVTIKAPYGPEDCYCANPIVLSRVRTMVQDVPFGRIYSDSDSSD